MRPLRNIILTLLFELFDLLALNLSLLAAYIVVLLKDDPIDKSLIDHVAYSFQTEQFICLISINCLFFMVNYAIKMNRRKKCSYFSGGIKSIVKRSFKDIVCRAMLGAFTLFILSALLENSVANSFFVVLFAGFFIGLSIILVIVLKSFLSFLLRRGYNMNNIVIVGWNERSQRFIKYIEENKDLGYNILGIVDSLPKQQAITERYSIVSDLKNFEEYIRVNIIDEVAVFLPVKSHYEIIEKIITTAKLHGAVTRYSSDLFDLEHGKSTRVKSVQAENQFFLTMATGRLCGWKALIKRLVDLCISFVLLILCSPVFLFVAIFLKMTSPGPVFFKQKRVGLNKRFFYLYKFRTMVVDAEQQLAKLEDMNDVSGPVFKVKEDPRIIPIGFFLRKFSIDELPQLFNVLKGDMSLVGPRPLPIRDFNGFYRDTHRRRFSVRPGITCTWQIQGRNNVSFEEWMKLDLDYIDNWSLSLDLKILLQTIPAIFKPTSSGW